MAVRAEAAVAAVEVVVAFKFISRGGFQVPPIFNGWIRRIGFGPKSESALSAVLDDDGQGGRHPLRLHRFGFVVSACDMSIPHVNIWKILAICRGRGGPDAAQSLESRRCLIQEVLMASSRVRCLRPKQGVCWSSAAKPYHSQDAFSGHAINWSALKMLCCSVTAVGFVGVAGILASRRRLRRRASPAARE